MSTTPWAIGVDLGGTKIEIARVDAQGRLLDKLRRPTPVVEGARGVRAAIVDAVRELEQKSSGKAVGVGLGVAGQINLDGSVRFAPNLRWQNEPLAADLRTELGCTVAVTNDVRAAAWGEWLHGAGQGCDDLICLFVGTGIGGGVVCGGQMLAGASNTAGELGHMTVAIDGPECHCGNRGCFEALAGGWAIARRAQEAIAADAKAGAALVQLAGGQAKQVTAKTVAQGFAAGDPLAVRLVADVDQALVAGVVGLVNAFNPARFILGGGVIEGLPQLVERVDAGVRSTALAAAVAPLAVLPAKLHNDAGVIGAAALAFRQVQ